MNKKHLNDNNLCTELINHKFTRNCNYKQIFICGFGFANLVLSIINFWWFDLNINFSKYLNPRDNRHHYLQISFVLFID